MVSARSKGYRIERKVKLIFEKHGWTVTRAGASLGEADLVCIKKGECLLLQVKSKKGKAFYYYEYMKKKLEGFPFYLVVDFGHGKIRILHPKHKVIPTDGIDLLTFLKKCK